MPVPKQRWRILAHHPEGDSEAERKNKCFGLLARLSYRVFAHMQRLNRIRSRDAGRKDELQLEDIKLAERNGKS